MRRIDGGWVGNGCRLGCAVETYGRKDGAELRLEG